MPNAYVFPGQGSQFVGMGRALAEQYPEARATFAEADEALGFALGRLCWDGPEAELTETSNAQPAILTAALAAWRVLSARFPSPPAFMAGHSLGEISALVAAGALGFADGVRLVRERGNLMRQAGAQNPGGMAAVLGGEREMLAAACAEASAATGQIVQIANDNAPGQVVLSGARAALERAGELARAGGAKRVMPLPVSIASHSALMAPAAEGFRRTLAAVPFGALQIPVIGNVQAAELGDADAIRQELAAQLTSAVRWTDSVRHMHAAGVTLFVELGPKDVLTGLLKRIAPAARGIAAGEPAGVESALSALSGGS